MEADIEARLALPPSPASAAAARRFIQRTLDEWGCGDLRHDVTLLVSELVTNAILHARSELEVVLRRKGAALRVEVGDGSSLPPVIRNYEDEAMTGRGLSLVERLTTAWGVEERPNGKIVWFEVPAG